MHPTSQLSETEVPPSPFAILTTTLSGNGYVTVEASDSWGGLVSCVLPFRLTARDSMQASLLRSWRDQRRARGEARAALVHWSNEGAQFDEMAD